MRLTPLEKQHICDEVAALLTEGGALYLYGSRTDDSAAGGDIDLLLVVSDARQQEEIASQKHLLLTDIKELIGNQRIDLSIATTAQVDSDPFYQSIIPSTQLLAEW